MILLRKLYYIGLILSVPCMFYTIGRLVPLALEQHGTGWMAFYVGSFIFGGLVIGIGVDSYREEQGLPRL